MLHTSPLRPRASVSYILNKKASKKDRPTPISASLGTLTVALSLLVEYGERTVYTEPCPPPPIFDSLQTDALPQPHLPSPLPVLAWLHKPEIRSSTHFSHNLSSVPSNSTHCQKTNHITSKDKLHYTTALPKILQVLMGSSPYPIAQLDMLPETTSSLTTPATQALPWCKIQHYPHVSCCLPFHRLFPTPNPFAPFHLWRPYFKSDIQSRLPQ